MAVIGAGRIEESVETLWAGAKPRSTEFLLSASLAERCCTNQGLAGVGPAIGMGAMGVVVHQVSGQACDEFLSRCEVAAFEESTRQGAEPQFDLIEPGAVLGREVEHMLVFGIGQEGASLVAGTEVFFVEGQAVELSHEFANVQAPMGVQVVENPMEALVVGEL